MAQQSSLEGFLSPGSTFKKHQIASAKRPAPETTASPPRKRSKTAASQGQLNARGDLGEHSTAAQLAEPTETPYNELMRVIGEASKSPIKPEGDVILYWMRMKDLRLSDNRTLSAASALARSENKTLVVLHVLSPNDFRAHHRAPRRIDFVLRNLRLLKEELAALHIPLEVISVAPRRSLPARIVQYARQLNASHIFASIEYEVDELEQLTNVLKLAELESIATSYIHDHCVIPPNHVLTGQGKPYSVYSPWYRNWCSQIVASPGRHLDEEPAPDPNPPSVLLEERFRRMFASEVPESVEGFELDAADAEKMAKWWPAGEAAARAALDKFVQQRTDEVKTGEAGIAHYNKNRSRPDLESTSRMSAYIAAGVISTRAVLRATLPMSKNRLQVDKATAVGTWVSEVAWRDFYQHIMASFCRVVKGHAFQTKYDGVVWENDEKLLQAWKDGKTGFPLIDAGMRQVVEEGWMHNRVRMCVASFLSKDLMFDWRAGERFFMENLMDGDFGSNNGGWQWSSGTGADPQPYFRIFNPLAQSEKFDPNGDYLRKYLPELRGLKGKDIHDPYKRLSKAAFEKLGYPKPICDHAKARKRAIARFKNIGEAVDE